MNCPCSTLRIECTNAYFFAPAKITCSAYFPLNLALAIVLYYNFSLTVCIHMASSPTGAFHHFQRDIQAHTDDHLAGRSPRPRTLRRPAGWDDHHPLFTVSVFARLLRLSLQLFPLSGSPRMSQMCPGPVSPLRTPQWLLRHHLPSIRRQHPTPVFGSHSHRPSAICQWSLPPSRAHRQTHWLRGHAGRLPDTYPIGQSPPHATLRRTLELDKRLHAILVVFAPPTSLSRLPICAVQFLGERLLWRGQHAKARHKAQRGTQQHRHRNGRCHCYCHIRKQRQLWQFA